MLLSLIANVEVKPSETMVEHTENLKEVRIEIIVISFSHFEITARNTLFSNILNSNRQLRKQGNNMKVYIKKWWRFVTISTISGPGQDESRRELARVATLASIFDCQLSCTLIDF